MFRSNAFIVTPENGGEGGHLWLTTTCLWCLSPRRENSGGSFRRPFGGGNTWDSCRYRCLPPIPVPLNKACEGFFFSFAFFSTPLRAVNRQVSGVKEEEKKKEAPAAVKHSSGSSIWIRLGSRKTRVLKIHIFNRLRHRFALSPC